MLCFCVKHSKSFSYFMKYTLTKALWVLGLATVLSSCVVHRKSDKKVVVVKKGSHDNGLHKGWYKNSNNPHHPRTTNPGHTKHKGKGNTTTIIVKEQHGKGKKGKH